VRYSKAIVLFSLFVCVALEAAKPTPRRGFIVFSSHRGGRWRIWRMNPDGTQCRALTDTSHEAVMPTVSPDGKWIAYWEGHNSTSRKIRVMTSDGHQNRQLVVDADKTHVPLPPA